MAPEWEKLLRNRNQLASAITLEWKEIKSWKSIKTDRQRNKGKSTKIWERGEGHMK